MKFIKKQQNLKKILYFNSLIYMKLVIYDIFLILLEY